MGAQVVETTLEAIRVAAVSGKPVDSAGAVVNPDAYAQVLTYNGDGTVNTIAFTDGTNTWTQTFSYTAGNVTGISKWVKS